MSLEIIENEFRERNSNDSSGENFGNGNVDGSEGNFSGSEGNFSGSEGNFSGSGSGSESGSGSGSESGSGGEGNRTEFRDGDFKDVGIDSIKFTGTENELFGKNRFNRKFNDRSETTRTAGNGVANGSGNENREPESEYDTESIFRVGKRQRGRPRKVVDSEKTSIKKSTTEIKNLISIFLDSIFTIPAIILNQSFWKLNDEENKLLTESIVNYLDSMAKSESNKVSKLLSEKLPLFNLLLVGFFIFGDKIQKTIESKKNEKEFMISAKKPTKNESNEIFTNLDGMFVR